MTWRRTPPWSRLLGLSLLLCACRSTGESPSDHNESSEPGSANAVAPPPFTDATPGVLLVWLDGAGDFHTTGRITEVPEASRATVRVIFEHSAGPRPDAVWLAHLDQRRADGSYVLTPAPRADWEKHGLAQRNAKVETERPTADPAPIGPAALGVDAIIYGADWCKPCHMAEDYLKKRGARVVKKDIEEDPEAGAEMRRKLQSAGLGGSGIPVLDVGGTLLVGFSESAIDSALRRSGK